MTFDVWLTVQDAREDDYDIMVLKLYGKPKIRLCDFCGQFGLTSKVRLEGKVIEGYKRDGGMVCLACLNTCPKKVKECMNK